MGEEKQEELHFRDELFEELMYGKQEKSSKTKRNTQVLELPRDISTMNVASIPQNYTMRMERIAEQMFSTSAARSWIYCKLSPYFKKEEQTLREAEKLTNDAKKAQIKIYGLTERLQDVKKRKGVKILSYLNVFTSVINLVASGYKLVKALKEGVSSALFPQISFAGNLQLFIMSKNQREIMSDVIKIKAGGEIGGFVQSLADAILAPYIPTIMNMCEEILWLTVDAILLIIQLIPKLGSLVKKASFFIKAGMTAVKAVTKSAKVINTATKISNFASKAVKTTDRFFKVTKTGRIITKVSERAKSIRDFMYGTVKIKGVRIPTRRIYHMIHDSGACLGAFQGAADMMSNALLTIENAFGSVKANPLNNNRDRYDSEEINTQIAGQSNADINELLSSHDYSLTASIKNGKLSLGNSESEISQNFESLTLTVLQETFTTIMNTVSMTLSNVILTETEIGNFLSKARTAMDDDSNTKTSSRQEAEDVMDQEGETDKARFIRYSFTTKNQLYTSSYIIKIFNAKDKTIANKGLTGKERLLSNDDGIIKRFSASNPETLKNIHFEFSHPNFRNTFWFSQIHVVHMASSEIIRVAGAIKEIIEHRAKIDYRTHS